MGIPTEVPTDGLNPVVTPTAPPGAITAGQFQGLLKCPGIGDVRQKTVVTTVLDALGPPSSVATIGKPQAAASSRVSPKGSVNAGFTNSPPRHAAQRYKAGI